jgi:hypothetical protein
VDGHSALSTGGGELLASGATGWMGRTGGEGAGGVPEIVRKTWVKLPSSDAESEAPGEE